MDSPAPLTISISNSSEILKSVILILAINGFTDSMIPLCFAFTIMPSVPVIARPSDSAIFLAL
jgi:hypothetical protein